MTAPTPIRIRVSTSPAPEGDYILPVTRGCWARFVLIRDRDVFSLNSEIEHTAPWAFGDTDTLFVALAVSKTVVLQVPALLADNTATINVPPAIADQCRTGKPWQVILACPDPTQVDGVSESPLAVGVVERH